MEMKLERVMGATIRNQHCMAINPVTGEIAYTAGSVIVIADIESGKQNILSSRSSKLSTGFSCVAYSWNGEYIAGGEYFSHGKNPEVIIWKVKKSSLSQLTPESDQEEFKSASSREMEYEEITILKGHKVGIEQITFTSCSQYLISLGDLEDRGLFVWDIKKAGRSES